MKFRQHIHKVINKLPSSTHRGILNLVRMNSDRTRSQAVRALVRVSMMESPECAICGKRNLVRHTLKNGFVVVRCLNDGLLFVSPRPVELTPFYEEGYYNGEHGYQEYSSHAAESLVQWNERLDVLEAEVGNHGRLLDVGCATGIFLGQARLRKWDVKGIELSGWAVKVAQESGLSVLEGGLPDARIPSTYFDAVTLFDCIEHVSDPCAVLQDIRRSLKPDGLLMISTGAVPHNDPRLISSWYCPPWHLYYFSEQTIRALLKKCGFEVVSYQEQNQDIPQYALMIVVARLTQREN